MFDLFPETVKFLDWTVPILSIVKGAAILAPVIGLAINIWLKVRSALRPEIGLRGEVLCRSIVLETTPDIPAKIIDDWGDEIENVYIFLLRIWNVGKKHVTRAEISTSHPLEIIVGESARVLTVAIGCPTREVDCDIIAKDYNRFEILFDCLNPGEYLVLPIYVTGDRHAEVMFSGRVFGQEPPLFDNDKEEAVTFLERSAMFIIGCCAAFTPVGFVGGISYAIYHNVLIQLLILDDKIIPHWILAIFGISYLFIYMFACKAIFIAIKRRRHPKGFPLGLDFLPSEWENFKLLWATVLTGRRHMVSQSVYDYGAPVLPKNPGKLLGGVPWYKNHAEGGKAMPPN